MREFDVAIVGAGIAGASLAWQLAGERSVLLLERETQPGYHATGRSAAMFMESYGPPAVRALTRASRAFYETPPHGFTQAALLAPRGVLYLATHGQEALLEAMQRTLAASGSVLDRVDADAALARVGCLRPDVVHGALYEPGAQDIDVNALHQGFLRGMRARGGELRTGADVIAAQRSNDRWTLRLADGEAVQARTVVDAAGAWADDVAAVFGAAPIGLVPHRRSAFTFKAPEGSDVSDWPAVVGVDESYYFKPDAGRLLGSPANADPTVPHDVVPEELDIALGIHQIEAVTTLTIRRPASTWAGLRSFVRDGEPVIGWDEHCPGFFWLAGQGGYGIQSAAGAAALAATLLRGAALPPDLVQQGVDVRALAPQRLR
ncbi:FAD-binding oxidoreductase [Rhizobacter sp. OV335]|uniref:NAD(P)/FAD-dependent oxidoreductase n=1 Tax=Rhizobacter sp. OV335 TaxID=1500264 RepID=UPI00092086E9|nr:FAD-dependent oxidoreductase [Rhizobacter sp. OV335]SHN08491.1 Glycine/D-amino acid oxidase [Rhizobacter sp. OV335]